MVVKRGQTRSKTRVERTPQTAVPHDDPLHTSRYQESTSVSNHSIHKVHRCRKRFPTERNFRGDSYFSCDHLFGYKLRNERRLQSAPTYAFFIVGRSLIRRTRRDFNTRIDLSTNLLMVSPMLGTWVSIWICPSTLSANPQVFFLIGGICTCLNNESQYQTLHKTLGVPLARGLITLSFP